MAWVALTIEINAGHTEILSDALLAQGALSVDIHDAAEGTSKEQMLFDEPGEPTGAIWHDSEVTALFDADVDIAEMMRVVTHTAQLTVQPNYRQEDIEEQDWVRLTQSQFDPIRISDRLWIVPTWHQLPNPEAINLILDPGLAFGTGSHPTTQLCLAWLDAHLQQDDIVLDYGCGSGILAIAALKLGASSVVGVDIDPKAVEASIQNAASNHCDPENFLFTTAGSDYSISDVVSQADVVVANILANPLVMLAPLLANATGEDGHIVLSGVLQEQVDDIKQAYQQFFDMHVYAEDSGWVLLVGRKK